MELKNRTLSNFAELVRTGECKNFKGRLKVGVDLGTANTVLAVVDNTNRPIAGISAPSRAIRDGVIVNFYESVQLVTKLKAELEEKLKTELPYAAAAIPPGVSQGSTKSIQYVLEGAGFEVTNIVDEPTAAAAVLKITDGAVVDVGGVTTGISILKNGKVIYAGQCSGKGMNYQILQYNTHYNGIHISWWTNGVGGSGSALWTLSGSKLVSTSRAYCSVAGFQTGKDEQHMKNVSQASFNSYCDKHFRNCKQYTMWSNTSENRIKHLK